MKKKFISCFDIGEVPRSPGKWNWNWLYFLPFIFTFEQGVVCWSLYLWIIIACCNIQKSIVFFLEIWKMSHFCLPFWQYWDWFELHRALVNACFDRLVLFKGDTMGSNPKSRLFLAKSRNLLCRCCCSLLECLLLRLNVLLFCWKKPGNFLGHS